ncbi:MAG TPA: hypothetical protein VEQ10_06475 [Vicinamibacteria bacterium]|nr:hypothetical protein [Vicinamibacteria bacterium]
MIEGLKRNLAPEAGKKADPAAEKAATEAKLEQRAGAMGTGSIPPPTPPRTTRRPPPRSR